MDHERLFAEVRELSLCQGARAEVLGRSLLGQQIPMLMLGEGQGLVVYVAGIRAGTGSLSLALLAFAREYLACLSRKGEVHGTPISYLFSRRTVCVVPVLNPDGMLYRSAGVAADNPLRERLIAMNGEDFSAWSANGRGVDLGRNFGQGFLEGRADGTARGADYSGAYPESEPESAALARFLRGRHADLLGLIALEEGGGRIECSCEDNLTAKSMAVGRVLSRASGYPLARPESLRPHGGIGDFCVRGLGRPAYTVRCEEAQGKQERLYARLRHMFFGFPLWV